MDDDWNLPWDGGCRCGRLRLRVSAPPLMAMACHCTGCQRLTASAFSLTVMVPSAGFAITSGEPAVGGLHGAHAQLYCPHCMSWVFTRPAGMPEIVNLRATMLDDPSWFAPFIETATRERLPWATTPALHSFPAYPEPSEYEGLMQDFARRGARPGRAASG